MDEVTVKVLLLGDDKVGKTTFLSRISRGSNGLEGHATITLLRDIDQPFIFEIRNRRRTYRLEFYDTSCPEDWRLLKPDLVLICYDISQRLSLINMQRLWIKQVHSTFQTSDSLPIMVVGLKRDLRSETDPNGIIYPQEGYKVSQEMRVDKYVECSAVTGELLKLAFEEICNTAAKTVTAEGGQSEGGCVIS
ncbi:P-loop containing nucleoside triphosphate hydrolase protein [Annulohypoxylon maeteangense]|uniref:P-loop containing nucleoside triphosphate hydrolase protein n=1 Tax=Annulohypoxylon maeteangense TaxID=1927788 RepID=UPI0020079032|nr:P-loop containing nucleoside triphosphate hydrolase protein [Annulohypoxylon maeteangense]KAI0885367.1 P-loop containing nucleoside triphosphate hydrolase protein [Annulohypoxylon maeteangense]